MKIQIYSTLFTSILCCMQVSAASICNTPKSTLSALDRVYKSNQFRIYYSSQVDNEHYIPDQTDLNHNQIPDYVENIAIQANATTDALTVLGFKHPLQSARYKNVAHYIDIHVLKMSGNGVAYELPSHWINKASKENKCALLLVIRHNLEGFPRNNWTTVTHEIFHLYQYGYSQFKGRWYLEGMTNLMERLLKQGAQGGNGLTPLPSTSSELEQKVYNVPYNHLWHRLAVLSDQTDGQLSLPKSLLNRTYLDGSKVFKDDKLKGHAFIKTVLENMDTMGHQLSKENNWDQYNWAETAQQAPSNRAYMLNMIQKTMHQFEMNQTLEQQNFLKLK